MYTLKTITKRNNSFLYHIEIRISDEIYHVEMKRHRLNSKSINLICTSCKCSAKVSLIVKPKIPILKIGNHCKFAENIAESAMLDLTNYGEIIHCHRKCLEIRNDGTCRMTRHEQHCLEKGHQETKRKKATGTWRKRRWRKTRKTYP